MRRVTGTLALITCGFLSLDCSAQVQQDCSQLQSVVQRNECLARELGAAESELQRTEAEILASLPDSTAAETFKLASRAGTEYRDLLCRSLYESYQGGSLGGPSIVLCKIRLTQERTRTVKEMFTFNG